MIVQYQGREYTVHPAGRITVKFTHTARNGRQSVRHRDIHPEGPTGLLILSLASQATTTDR